MREEAEEMGADRSNERVRCLEGARDISWQEVETTQDSVCHSRPPWGDFFPHLQSVTESFIRMHSKFWCK